MSTKGLMAHKKVEEVTLNAAGKAETLTLRAPWLYNGERGPFKLTNVEHGHTIVKGATSDGSAPTTAPKAAAPRSVAPSQPGVDPEPRAERPLKPHTPRGDEVLVYRIKLVSEEHNHEICGWVKYSRDPEAAPPTKAELNQKCWDTLKPSIKAPRKSEDYKPQWKRWTNKDQAAARKNDEHGSPWGSENHGD